VTPPHYIPLTDRGVVNATNPDRAAVALISDIQRLAYEVQDSRLVLQAARKIVASSRYDYIDTYKAFNDLRHLLLGIGP
jgi:hypothetical protein